MSVRAGIAAVLRAGGQVTFPHKERQNEWFAAVTIAAVDLGRGVRYCCPDAGIRTDDLDAAVDAYCRRVFTPANLGLVYAGIRRHGLTDVDFDDLSPQKLSALIRRYRRDHWAGDHPEFAGVQP